MDWSLEEFGATLASGSVERHRHLLDVYERERPSNEVEETVSG